MEMDMVARKLSSAMEHFVWYRYTYGIGTRTAKGIVRKVGLGEEGLISLARQN